MENKPTLKEKIAQLATWVTLVTAGFLVIFFFVNFIQVQRQQDTLDKQNKDIRSLVQQAKELSQQNKALSEDNNELAERNTRYAYCNAVLLAQYTQTGKPMKIEDLDRCILETFPSGQEIIDDNIRTSKPILQDAISPIVEKNSSSQATIAPTVTPAKPMPTVNEPPTAPSTAKGDDPGLRLNPSISLSPTFLTPGVNLDTNVDVSLPCVSIPYVLRFCK